MILVKKIGQGLIIFIIFQACSLAGIHFKVSNPAKPGSYPVPSRSLKLLAGETQRRSCYDVKYYKLAIQLGEKERFVKGTVLMRSVLLYRHDTLQLDLNKSLVINKITCNGIPLSFSRDEGAVLFKLPPGVIPGALFDIVIDYQGQVNKARRPPWEGGMVWKNTARKGIWAGVCCESEGASIWWPNKDDASDEADSVDLAFRVPDKPDLWVVSNGVLRQVSKDEKGFNTFLWHVSYPINNYNITFYLGAYSLIHDKFVSGPAKDTIDIEYYVLRQHEYIAKDHFQQVKSQLSFYETVFGPYPWTRDGFKLVESPYEGMEHQTAIAYGSKFKNGVLGVDEIVLHETAHEWWGNSVTAADLSDVWLQEGFATYAEALYIEAAKGSKAFEDYLYWQKLMIKNKRPVVRPRGIRYFTTNDEDVYYKGAWILHSLRCTINNDSLFFAILKSFREENHLKQIFSSSFIELVNNKTGVNYDWFFSQYLYRREAPVLDYYLCGDEFYYKWANTNPDFNKLPVLVHFSSGDVTIYPGATTRKLKVESQGSSRVKLSGKTTYFGFSKNRALAYE